MHDRKAISLPARGVDYTVLTDLTSEKLMLYQGMRDKDITKAKLVGRLRCHLPRLDRVLDILHHSRLDQMDVGLAPTVRWIDVAATTSDGSAVAHLRYGVAIDPAGSKTGNSNGYGDPREEIEHK